MPKIKLEIISGERQDLSESLLRTGLPIDDINELGRTFYRAIGTNGKTVAYSGIEWCEGYALLRSVVVLPEYRGQGIGRELIRQTVREIPISASIFLITTTAAPYFEQFGFTIVDRASVPPAIRQTKQLSVLCPESATVMRLSQILPNE